MHWNIYLCIMHCPLQSRGFGKLGRQEAICWLKKELFLKLGTLHIFLGIKPFLFLKIESWNFQQLFDIEFHETSQKFSLFRQHSDDIAWIPKSKRCLKFQLSILTNEKVLFLNKMYEVYHFSRIVLFSTNRWPLDVLTFLIHGFDWKLAFSPYIKNDNFPMKTTWFPIIYG